MDNELNQKEISHMFYFTGETDSYFIPDFIHFLVHIWGHRSLVWMKTSSFSMVVRSFKPTAWQTHQWKLTIIFLMIDGLKGVINKDMLKLRTDFYGSFPVKQIVLWTSVYLNHPAIGWNPFPLIFFKYWCMSDWKKTF